MRGSVYFIGKLLLVAGVAVTLFFVTQQSVSAAVDPDIPASEVNAFCQDYTRGFMDKMHLTDARGRGIDMAQALTVPAGATSIPFYFKFEMWFCKDRVTKTNDAVKTCSYGLILESDYDRNNPSLQPCGGNWKPVGKNLLSNINPVDEMYRTTDPMTSPGGTPHYKFTNTVVHSANLQTKSLKEGANRICHVHSFYSYASNPVLIQGGTTCFTLNIKFSWETSGTTSLSVNGATQAGTPNASVGSKVKWSHVIKNDGKGTTDKTITSYMVNTGRTPGTSGSWPQTARITEGENIRSVSDTYTIDMSDVGKTICQRIAWSPQSSASSGVKSTDARCVTVPRQFNLIPAISGFGGSMAPGSPVTVRPSITNRVSSPGVTTSTPGTVKWQLSRFTLAPGVNQPADVIGSPVLVSPCTYYSGSCPIGSGDSGTRSFDPGVTPMPQVDESIASNLPLGTQICYGLSVSPPTGASGDAASWRHVSRCLTINRRPTVQIWGGDVRAGSIVTGISVGMRGSDSAIYGSWGEYGVLARGLNDDMASGSGLAGGLAAESASGDPRSQYHHLTFANKSTGGVAGYGNFKFTTTNQLSAQFTSLPATATMQAGRPLNDMTAPGVTVYRPTTDITLSASEIAARKTIIINAGNRTVTVTGDLTYANGPYNDLSQLPQVIIIARNIYIESSVKQLDAWLLTNRTNGVIDTCSNVGLAGTMPASGGTLADGVCSDALTVHGPVATNKLILKRTAGATAGAGRDASAELFNLRSDAYMWLNWWTQYNAQAWSAGVSELPPRY